MRSMSDSAMIPRLSCGVGDSTGMFSVSSAREVMESVYYMWEQPWPIATTRYAVGLLHWLGGERGGHSSLQLGGIVVYKGSEAATSLNRLQKH
jgi:hypothetical protein